MENRVTIYSDKGIPLDVVAVDRQLLRSLPPCLTEKLREDIVDQSTEEFGFDYEFAGYRLTGLVPPEDLEASAISVRNVMAPPVEHQIQEWLTELRLSTKSREMSRPEAALTIEIYAGLCGEYPADVVYESVMWWANNEKFWPAKSELRELMEARVKKRRALLKTIEAALR